MDKRETERFLIRLFQPEESFEVAYIQPDGPVRRVQRALDSDWGTWRNNDLLHEMERAEKAGFNVYVSVLPVLRQGRNGVVGSYDRVWVDQDDPTAPWPWAADADPRLPEPTTLVHTSFADGGARWQAIWLLDPEDALDADDGKRFIKRLAKKLGADESVNDLRRVLRVPGIVNAKRGQLARLVSTSEGYTSPEAFDLPKESAVEKLLAIEVNSPQAVLGEWLGGVEEGDRNRKAYVVARFLKGCEVEMMDAGAIMKLGSSRCDPPLPDHELEHALKSAFYRA